MTEDWAADVRKFAPNADEGVIAGIVSYCGIALRNQDSSLVSFSDPAETGRVRENFLRKKLGLTQPDDVLDGAIATVGERMRAGGSRNRVTAYYLLLEHFGLTHLFARPGFAETAPAEPVAAPAYLGSRHEPEEVRGGIPWWVWALLGLLALLLIWWLFLRTPVGTPVTPGSMVTTEAVPTFEDETVMPDETASVATPPAEGTVAIPEGAGVLTETRDGKPVVKVYFETAKTEVAPAFGAAAAALKTYLGAHPGAALAVSGFNDETGNAAANAELAKNRAKAVQAALVASGIPEAKIVLAKPQDSTDTTTTDSAARRVEVVVQ